MEFNIRDYKLTHGKTPKGRGSWAFCPTDKYRLDNYLEFTFWARRADGGIMGLTYGEAKRIAAAHFKAQGISDITVCT